jgi:hypothetical protein
MGGRIAGWRADWRAGLGVLAGLLTDSCVDSRAGLRAGLHAGLHVTLRAGLRNAGLRNLRNAGLRNDRRLRGWFSTLRPFPAVPAEFKSAAAIVFAAWAVFAAWFVIVALLLLSITDAHAAYESVDLSRFISADGYMVDEAVAINNRGDIAGHARKQPLEPGTPLMPGSPGTLGIAGAPGASGNSGNSGVSGASAESAGNRGRAFRLREGKLENLGVFVEQGATGSVAYGLSEAGVVTGAASKGGVNAPALWEPGQPLREVPLGAASAPALASPTDLNFVRAISPDGVWMIIGTVIDNRQRTLVMHAGEAPALLEPLGGDGKGGAYILPEAVNDRGQVVGLSSCVTGRCSYLWEEGKLTLLAPPPGARVEEDTTVKAIDQRGNAVGCYVNNRGATLPVFWPVIGRPRVLPLPAGFEGGCARAINGAGVVVGDMWHGIELRTFIWDAAHGARDLGEMTLLQRGWRHVRAVRAINDQGAILVMVASGVVSSALSGEGGDYLVPVLLRPIAEREFYLRKYRYWLGGAATVLMLLAAAVLFARRGRAVRGRAVGHGGEVRRREDGESGDGGAAGA